MAAGAWTFPDASRAKLLDGTFDVADDTFKMALFLSHVEPRRGDHDVRRA